MSVVLGTQPYPFWTRNFVHCLLNLDKCHCTVETLKCDCIFLKIETHPFKSENCSTLFDSSDFFFNPSQHWCSEDLYVDTILNFKDNWHLFSVVQDATQLCLHVRLMLFQNLIRKHDFLAFLKSIQKVPAVETEYSCVLMFILQHSSDINFTTWILPKHKFAVASKSKTNHKYFSAEHIEMKSVCIGGGKYSTFLFDDLKKYALNSTKRNFSKFRFKAYVSKSDTLVSETDNLFANYPLHLLIPNLTIPDLRVIAACHGIYLHSKQHLAHIQNTILEHTCTECSEYACEFEPIDEDKILMHKKMSNLKAVKKYQDLNHES
jgi:hypothetical protein